MRFFKRLRSYIKYFTKYKWLIIWEAIKTQPYDYAFLLKLEKAKLKEMEHYFKHSNISYEDGRIARDINLAIKLLNIIDQTTDTFNFKMGNEVCKIDDEEHLLPIGSEYECLVNVNTRNKGRFGGDNILFDRFPDTLYVAKAENLYYKLLKERLNTWWN